MEKRIGPVRLRYLAGEGLEIVVSYDAGRNRFWTGVASFPWEMEDEAVSWMDRIHSPNDVEDLLRQWAPAETWESFQEVRSEVGV